MSLQTLGHHQRMTKRGLQSFPQHVFINQRKMILLIEADCIRIIWALSWVSFFSDSAFSFVSAYPSVCGKGIITPVPPLSQRDVTEIHCKSLYHFLSVEEYNYKKIYRDCSGSCKSSVIPVIDILINTHYSISLYKSCLFKRCFSQSVCLRGGSLENG